MASVDKTIHIISDTRAGRTIVKNTHPTATYTVHVNGTEYKVGPGQTQTI